MTIAKQDRKIILLTSYLKVVLSGHVLKLGGNKNMLFFTSD